MSEATRLLIDAGICPVCAKERIYANETKCEKCKEQFRYYYATYRERHREEYNRKSNEYRKKVMKKRKEEGLCYRCGKRKPESGFACEICKEKQRNFMREKRRKDKCTM